MTGGGGVTGLPLTLKSDRLFAGALGDGLLGCPFEGFDEPGVAGHADSGGAFVDAVGEVVRESEQHLLRHDRMLSLLISAIRSDITMDMTTKRICQEWVIYLLRQEPNVKAYWEEWGAEYSADAADGQLWRLEDEVGVGNVRVEASWAEANADGSPAPNGRRWREVYA